MSLSLCIIVKNEEHSLPKCLSSVKNIVNEIVVVDTGSTDKTREIARKFGAKVYDFQWCDDFSIARNEALKYVTGKWVLVLDADETLKPEIVPQLKAAIATDKYILINLIRQELGSVQSPYSLVSRLFRNHDNIKFNRPYHALVDDSITEILKKESYWKIGYLSSVAIIHYGYQKAVINHQNKYDKAIKAMGKFYQDYPDDIYVCSKLGALYVEIGEISQGLALLEKGLNLILASGDKGEDINYDILYELHYHLGIAYGRLSNSIQAIHHYNAAVNLPVYGFLKLGSYNNLGNLLKAQGDLSGAKMAYELAIGIDANFITGYYNLGMVCKAMGLWVEAINAYDQAINLNPDYAEAYQNLGVVLLKIGDVQNSLIAFENAIALHEQYNPEEAERLKQGLKEMGFC